ncbi:MAG: DUF975 family protein [Lachnospiraceae bacterium]|nr:DUF975 family protein [Lachnospiraceae bacterium]
MCGNRSLRMMKGLRWTYVKLILSFIGYGLLSLISLGVGLIWLIPYIFTARALFYDKVRAVPGMTTGQE